jgi:CYTH domain-containing protein
MTMSTPPPPKYSLAEIERRWLLTLAEAGPLDGYPCSLIEDRYLAGTSLRLRKVVGVGGVPVLKFCKKYGRGTGLAEPITNLYLSQAEYDILSQLGGMPVRKRRYAVDGGALDVYESPHAGLALFSVEFASEAAALAYTPPHFVRAEVTHDPRYTGAALAGLRA